MNGTHRFRSLVPVVGAIALFILTPTVSALGDGEVFFFDDFGGSTLDASKWDTAIAMSGVRYTNGVWTMPPKDSHYGSVTVADSRLSLDNLSPTPSCSIFPLLWTNTAIPAAGNFELELRMRYTGAGYWGDGIRIVRMPAAFEPSEGSTDSAKGDYVLMIHQDNVDCKGPNVSLLGHPGEGSETLPFNLDWHTYALRYRDGGSTLYIDGVYFDGPLPTPRPNCIQLGVGESEAGADSCAPYGCNWTSYTVDYIKVTLLGTTPTRTTSWGAVKMRYR